MKLLLATGAVAGGEAAPVDLGAGNANSAVLRLIRRGRSFSGHEPHCCFLNTGTQRFANVSAASALNLGDDGRGVGKVDWDLDGDVDLWITNRSGPQLRFLRNSLPAAEHHYLAVRLQGTTCNRDAIGARVEIELDETQEPRRVQALAAGDGFLSQSSKWIHFGLGGQTRIRRLVVRWPDGRIEVVRGLQADRRYLMVQGTGQTEVLPTAHAPLPSNESPLKEPVSSHNTMEVFSASEVPIPRLPYRTLDGQRAEVFTPGGQQPVLLNLWASWCPPCVTELSEFTRRQDELLQSGLNLVALNVDHLDDVNPVATDAPLLVLEKTSFPFRTGAAGPELVEKLQIVHNHLFDLHIPLPLPTSVLIDGQGRLAAFYKGPVSVDRVLDDVAALDDGPDARRQRSVPFSGRWFEPLNKVSFVPILNALTTRGFLAEADEYTRRMGTVRKERFLPAIVRLGMALYRKGDGAKARAHFKVAVEIDPTYVGVELRLGEQREREGRPESAAALYREALRRNPKSVEALNNLAWLLSTHRDDSIRDGSVAVDLGEQAARLTSELDPTILDTLAAAYAEADNFERAIELAQNALDLSQARGQLSLAVKIESRLRSYDRREPIRINPGSEIPEP